MPDLNVTLVQTELIWQSVEANLRRLADTLARLDAPTDLIVLPEMFSTGFSMDAPRLAEDMQGRAVAWLRDQSARLAADITGSLMIAEGGRYYNRLVWVKPDGALQTYDKRHRFAYAGEDRVYTAGSQRITVTLKGWRIRPFVCYDLRFPVWCRNRDLEYDAAIFVANWPASRSEHWKTLLRARAIENQAYVVGVNRVGRDGNALEYSGDSLVAGPQGAVRFEQAWQECSITVTLRRRELEEYRTAFPFWKDADREDP